MPYAFYIRVSELCSMVSFDIQYILELQIRILIFMNGVTCKQLYYA